MVAFLMLGVLGGLSINDMSAFRRRLGQLHFPVPPTLPLGAHTGPVPAPANEDCVHASSVHARLLEVSSLLQADGRIILQRSAMETALADLHLTEAVGASSLPDTAHPSSFLPAYLFAEEVDATELVRVAFARVLQAHPIFCAMAEQLLGNDDFYSSVYFGGEQRDSSSLSFEQLARRLVASVVVFEELLALDHAGHRKLAQWYEAQLAAARKLEGGHGAARAVEGTSGLRDKLMGFWLDLKGESVLASINAFEALRRIGDEARGGAAGGGVGGVAAGGAVGDGAANGADTEVRLLSDVLNAIMALNLFEVYVHVHIHMHTCTCTHTTRCAVMRHHQPFSCQTHTHSSPPTPSHHRQLSCSHQLMRGSCLHQAIVANLSFAYWPDNARAGLALLLAPTYQLRGSNPTRQHVTAT